MELTVTLPRRLHLLLLTCPSPNTVAWIPACHSANMELAKDISATAGLNGPFTIPV
jgi:hypothetical protein